jgi:alpha-tubulin suppressor-like RCC1 family protein/subtilisin family serine protease
MSPSQPRRARARAAASRRLVAFVSCLALAASLAAFVVVTRTASASRAEAQPVAKTTQSKPLPFVPGEILVRFRDEAKAGKAAAAPSSLASPGGEIPVEFDTSPGLEIVRGLRLARVPAEQTGDAIAALRARPDVLYAEPNYTRHKLAVPNDTRYSEQWSLKGTQQSTGGTNAEGAWDTTTGSRSVVVGVVDEGVDINHPDLQPNIWTNPGEIPGNGIDDDGDGYVDDVHGWDFFHNDASVYDGAPGESGANATDAHGTHCAGIIGAQGNNAQGIAGVNWQVSLMPLKILGKDGESPAPSSVLLTVRAYAYAKAMRDLYVSSGGARGANVRVLNNSYGGIGHSQAELDAINQLGASGILFVAAAGNDSESDDLNPVYPANYDAPNLINVASSDPGNTISTFSNFGARTVHMSAPGASILSTTPGNTYSYFSGTSMAAPHVAGAAALLCAARPDISVEKLRAALLFGGDAVSAQTGKTVTGRRLNVAGSMQLALAGDSVAPSVTDFRAVAQDGRSVTLAWTAPGDDGASAGQASLYEIRFVDQAAGYQTRLAALRPGPAGSTQSTTVKVPYQHQSGSLVLQAFDDAGNASTSTVPVTINDPAANPYTVSLGPPAALTTGGTPLHLNFDDFYTTYFLPFQFPFFEGYGNNGSQQVTVTSNGTLFFGQTPPNDSLSYVERLDGWRMIAGLWDDLDLRTCLRPDADVYVTQDTDHVVFRWQGVHFENSTCPASPSGSSVNFEVELRSDGTIVERYGDGNKQDFPVVGISGGEPSSYAVASHTSEFAPFDLTNAQTVTYTLRRPPAKADLRISDYPFNYPYPIRLGDEFDVPVTVMNAGPDRASGVRLTTTLPFQSAVSYVSCRTSQGACSAGDGGTVTADFGGLDDNATATAVFTFRANAASNFTALTHNVTSSSYDPSPDNSEVTIVNVVPPNPTPLTGVAAIAAGGIHSLALKPDGTVLAWGDNHQGQLGDGGLTPYAPVAQGVPGLSGVAAVAAGSSHSLALKTSGVVWAWGANSAGQLGDGTNTTRFKPVKVPGLSGVVAVAAGGHSLALKSDGTVWAWGSNDQGQLGDGTSASRSTPVQVSGLSNVIAVEAGSNFSVALKSDGTVWAWGANSLGQLGDGTGLPKSSPVRVQGLSGVTAISAGAAHALALKSDGTVWAWGSNNHGQLGDGTNASGRVSPVQVVGLAGVASVSCGDSFSLARKNDGTVWAWGYNASGQLGDGSFLNRSLPVKAVNIKGVVAVAAGGEHSLALTGGGTVWSWGDNTYGQLGSNGSSNRSFSYEAMQQRPDPPPIGTVSAPTFTPSGGTFGAAENVGVHVAGDNLTVGNVAVGGSSVLASASDGKLYAWGYNASGQIGVMPGSQYDTLANMEPLPRQQSLDGVVAMAESSSSSYALKSDGTVWAWGNSYLLGNGGSSGDPHPSPVQVSSLAGVTAIAAGAGHAVALKSDGTVWTWGSNNAGQLGDGTNNDHPTPMQVPGLSGVAAVASMFNTTYALKSDGTVWAWGDNQLGQAGDGTEFNYRKSPVQVANLSGVKSIFAGYNAGLAVRNDGTLWGWGTINNIIIPNAHPVEGLTNVRSAATGGDFAVALKEDGTVWVWGSNTRGQFGNGQTGGRVDTPQQVAALSGVSWLGLSEGYSSDCYLAALKSDGTLWVWGSNVHGQLGDGSVAPRYTPAPVETISGNIVVHYTTDGSDPTEDDPAIPAGGSVTVDHSLTLKARAWRDGWSPSGVSSALFAVSGNSIDDSGFFVRQHYLDFLGREPDAAGLQFWTGNIESCNDLQCRDVKRVNTSAAFFLSIEFQNTGYLVYRFHKAAYGNLAGKPVPVTRSTFLADTQAVASTPAQVVVGQAGWDQQLETNKVAFAQSFVQRPVFQTAYPQGMAAAAYVDALFANAGVAPTTQERDAAIAAYGSGDTAGRAAALRAVAENTSFQSAEFNRAFVLMQYFGYLRRDPDAAPDADFSGYNFWLSKLNQFGGNYVNAEMVKAFLTSTEYRKRFGTP